MISKRGGAFNEYEYLKFDKPTNKPFGSGCITQRIIREKGGWVDYLHKCSLYDIHIIFS